MEKEQIIKILSELGITTSNCFQKKCFIDDFEECVGLFPNELVDDFYFLTEFDQKIYVFRKRTKSEIAKLKENDFRGRKKYVIPLSECEFILDTNAKFEYNEREKVVPMEDLPDLNMQEMTIRRYACIHLGVPETDLPWLNEIIAKSKHWK